MRTLRARKPAAEETPPPQETPPPAPEETPPPPDPAPRVNHPIYKKWNWGNKS